MTMETARLSHRIIVIGGGPVGLLIALILGQHRILTTLITPSPPPPGTGAEARTAALFMPSIRLLQRARVFESCRPASAPVKGIRIVDDRGGLLRAPEILFDPSDIGLDAFGYNIPNGPLAAALRFQLAEELPSLTLLSGAMATRVEPDERGVTVHLADGRTVSGSLVVGADGRQSVCRTGANIGISSHAYEQTAITATFSHQRPHNGISTEMHGPAGPCTTVPLPGNASSLVWIERPAIAKQLLSLPGPELTASLERRLKGLLGPVSSLAVQGRFPLSWMQAETYGARRVMLAGEAAHIMPPVGAQGLNLGLRDAGYAIDCILDAAEQARDPGGPATIAAYNALRRGDIGLRMTAVDALNQSLLSEFLPVHLARGAGLHLLAAFAPLRRAVIAQGLAPSALPRLMRPQ